MVKVFYLVYGLTSGGIERYSVNLYRRIDQSKYDLQFVVKHNTHDFFDDEFASAGGKKVIIGDDRPHSKVWGKLVYLRNLIRIIRQGYDVAYFNLSTPGDVFKYPLICKLMGINKIIIHSHNSAQDEQGVMRKLINRLGRVYIKHIASVKFACSDMAAKWMFGERVMRNGEYQLINNGLEIEQYDFNQQIRSQLRSELGLDPHQLVIGHVGRFVEQKNHVRLLRVFQQVLKSQPNARLLLIGVGPLMSEIQKLAVQLQVASSVNFLGERTNVNEYLQAMDVFTLPSLYEGLPIAGVEAQAAGLPCVFADTISCEADITGNVKFLALSAPDKAWVKQLIEASHPVRMSQKVQIQTAGYDINYSTHQVEKTIDNLIRSN
ncbi:glycosyltransferase [Lactiplantibacillus plantarum]|uniref:glycosyltransferase n=1 Tax=Lactiplantibacillus plantarum TaxID=1590 RepID=UPI00155A2595|nr:glycosyltransferase [Lactiplantibacillus plantarum]WDT51921.1 glycosyltransferase [Lactiplantibacillus plantarum]